MPIGLLKTIIDTRPRDVRLLGLDIGKKTIGLALSDPAQTLATPLKTVTRVKFTKDIEQLAVVIRDYEIGGYVLGYPLNMDGSEGPRSESIRHFAAEMLNHPQIFGTDPWISLWDERLSTAAVESYWDNHRDMSRKKRDQVVDSLAAQIILKDAIEFLKLQKNNICT